MNPAGRPRKETPQTDFVFQLLNKITRHEKKLRGYAEFLPRHSCQREILLAHAVSMDLVRDWIHLLLRGDSLEKDKDEKTGDR